MRNDREVGMDLAAFSSLPSVGKALVVIGVMTEVSIVGREAYDEGPAQASMRLRDVNELQHRLAGLACHLLAGDNTWADSEVVSFIESGLSGVGSPRRMNSFIPR